MLLGVGIDLVDIDRMALAVKRTPSIVNKILTKEEIADLKIKSSVDLHLDRRFISSLSARFAAKEATVKSLSLSLFVVGLHNIRVIYAKSGAPEIIFPLASKFFESSEDIEFLCSLTHTQTSAGAVVIAQN